MFIPTSAFTDPFLPTGVHNSIPLCLLPNPFVAYFVCSSLCVGLEWDVIIYRVLCVFIHFGLVSLLTLFHIIPSETFWNSRQVAKHTNVIVISVRSKTIGNLNKYEQNSLYKINNTNIY